jgi:predicted DNA-binding transcriptional regulator AlpA
MLLNTEQAAEYLGHSKSWLDHARAKGEGPQAVRLGKKVMYRPCDLDQYITDNLEPAAA